MLDQYKPTVFESVFTIESDRVKDRVGHVPSFKDSKYIQSIIFIESLDGNEQGICAVNPSWAISSAHGNQSILSSCFPFTSAEKECR